MYRLVEYTPTFSNKGVCVLDEQVVLHIFAGCCAPSILDPVRKVLGEAFLLVSEAERRIRPTSLAR